MRWWIDCWSVFLDVYPSVSYLYLITLSAYRYATMIHILQSDIPSFSSTYGHVTYLPFSSDLLTSVQWHLTVYRHQWCGGGYAGGEHTTSGAIHHAHGRVTGTSVCGSRWLTRHTLAICQFILTICCWHVVLAYFIRSQHSINTLCCINTFDQYH